MLQSSDEHPGQLKDLDSTSGRLLTPPGKGLLLEIWEDGCSVFSPETGETHHLSVLPAEVLKSICAEPLAFDDLAASLAAACELEDSPEWREKIAAIVSELRRLELVQTHHQQISASVRDSAGRARAPT